MITQEQVFAEVKNNLRTYDEYDLIDEISLKNWFISSIKKFGNNVMVTTDAILDVNNNKTELPDDFWHLKEAWRYEPHHYCSNKGKIPIEYKRGFNNKGVSDDCDCDTSSYVSKQYVSGTSSFYVYYNKPSKLVLGSSFDQRVVSRDCLNLPNKVVHKNNNLINIVNRTINTEFKDGNIYLIYDALPTDLKGNVAVPDTQHGELLNYVIKNLEYRVVRDILLNEEDPNSVGKLNLLRAERNDAFNLAMTETKSGSFSPKSWKNIRNKNRLRKAKVERIVPDINF